MRGVYGMVGFDVMRRQAKSATAAIVLVALLILGGGSGDYPQTRVLAELLGIAFLVLAVAGASEGCRPAGAALLVPGLLAALVAVHLVPLPPAMWQSLPGRGAASAADLLVFGRPRWRPLSLDPEATERAAAFLVPAASVFFFAVKARLATLRALLAAWVAAAALSLLLALLQWASGGNEDTYLYLTSHQGLPTGLFANRNHQGIFLACVPAAVAALCRTARHGAGEAPASPPAGPAFLWVALSCALAAVGVLLTGSRTAAGLLPIGMAGAFAIVWPERRSGQLLWILPLVVLVSVAGLAGLTMAGGDALGLLGERAAPVDDPRFRFWKTVVAAASRFFPAGSGIGTFRAAYDAQEPLEAVAPLYVTHAHNDYLEIAVESGLAGVALCVAFLLWFGSATVRLWRARGRGGEWPLGLAGSIVCLLLLLHSAVDYPLRTVALSTVFAIAAACLWRAGVQAHPQGG